MHMRDIIRESDTEERDRRDRQIALEEYRKVILWLARGGRGMHLYDHFYFAKGRDIGLTDPDVWVAFGPGPISGEHGSKYTDDTENGILIRGLPQGPQEISDIARFMRGDSARGIFIHEYVHHMQVQRGDEVGVPIGADSATYFNNSAEIEAFYQQYVQAAEHRLSILPNSELAKLWRLPDQGILERIQFRSDFLDHLEPDAYRHLQQRLSAFVTKTIRPMMAKRLGLP